MLNDIKKEVSKFIEGPLGRKVLFFDEMLTPSLIRLAYWLLLVFVFWQGLLKIFSGGFGSFVSGLIVIVLGAILARVAAELVMVLFKINENIQKVADDSKASAPKTTKKVSKKKVASK